MLVGHLLIFLFINSSRGTHVYYLFSRRFFNVFASYPLRVFVFAIQEYSLGLRFTLLVRTWFMIALLYAHVLTWINNSSIVLQVVFCAVSLHNGPFSLSNLPWYIYVLAFCWPIIMIPVQELVKIHDKEEWTRFQKRSKLEFNTKLGMHSPI